MHGNDRSKLLSICIPSYNRGHRALELVKGLLDMECISKRDDIEIILSDNGSCRYTAEYEAISSMAGENLVYNRFDQNKDFYGNFNAVVKLSRGQWCLLLSDEDSINEVVFKDLIDHLGNMKDVGVIKAGTSKQYAGFSLPDGPLKTAGYNAIRYFFLMGNYISGTVYNRKYVTNELIDGLCGLYEGNEGYFFYPHLFVEAFVLGISDFYHFDKCLILEGEAEKDQDIAKNIDSLPVFSSWESRVAQLNGYLRLIRDLQHNDEISDVMIKIAVWRTVNLINLVREPYLDKGMDWGKICESAGNGILEEISRCGIPIVNNNMSGYLKYVAELIKTEMINL